jgi:transcriptional regulator with XRE-family HTH domain
MSSPELRRRIGWRVRLFRVAHQWSISALAAESGVNSLIIDSIEAGEPVDQVYLPMIARALGVPEVDLYSDADWAVVKVLRPEPESGY